MRLFVLCLYFHFLVFSLHVSGLPGPIIRGISSCCFYATIWFMQCFVGRLCASADWFVVVTSVCTIIRGISGCCFYATIWFMQCFVGRLCASADWFVVVTSV